jgi:hypothetical protein
MASNAVLRVPHHENDIRFPRDGHHRLLLWPLTLALGFSLSLVQHDLPTSTSHHITSYHLNHHHADVGNANMSSLDCNLSAHCPMKLPTAKTWLGSPPQIEPRQLGSPHERTSVGRRHVQQITHLCRYLHH